MMSEDFIEQGSSTIRGMVAEDEPFVINSWKMSTREHGFPWADRKEFTRFYLPFINRCLKSATKKLIACDPNDPDNIQGFIITGNTISNEQTLMCIYVKHIFRRNGIGRSLFNAALEPWKSTKCLTWSPLIETISRKEGFNGLRYDPQANERSI